MSVKIGRNDPCWCGSGRKYKTCHQSFDEKIEKYREAGCIVPTHDLIKTPKDIEGIRESAKINVAVLDYVAEHIKAGMSTEEIDRMVYEKTTAMGGIPAPLNYQGFPKSVCTSINEEVCHGIPSEDIILKDGDIINVDVSTILDGYFSDSSRMFLIGDVSEEKKRLVQVTKECVEEPWVGYHSKRGTEMLLVPGMMFTIEPMVNMGKEAIYIDDENNWTVYTEDGLPSAQWEIQVLVTEEGTEVISW